LIFGEEPSLQIAGVWIFRGQDIPEEMRTCDDFDQYNWKKLDPSDEQTKQLINDFWLWNGDFALLGGKKVNQGKAYK